jgi:acetyl esterase/lipase
MGRTLPTRRSILQGAAVLTMAASPFTASAEPAGDKGRIQTRPASQTQIPPPSPGLHKLGLSEARDGLLYVPVGHDLARPLPLVVLLHGAGGVGGHVVPMLQGIADQRGVLILAPDSRGRDTWDVIRGGYGPDIQFIDRALGYVFERFSIDPRRVAVGGFSDGASYALSIGLMNGDLSKTSSPFPRALQHLLRRGTSLGSSSATATRMRCCLLSAAAVGLRGSYPVRDMMSIIESSLAATSFHPRWWLRPQTGSWHNLTT